jgi:hypothetical protein
MPTEITSNAGLPANPTVVVEGLTNQQFLEQYAEAGRVGLSSGTSLVDRLIMRAERHVDPAGEAGMWTHAFVFEGKRLDGHQWILESDLHFEHKHIRLGVQENRITKYFKDELYSTLAVLDFGLAEHQVAAVVSEGLELVATHTRYSLRELAGTWLSLRKPELREKENRMARDRSYYCSAFVQQLFRKAGIDLAPGLDVKNTTPDDISRCLLPHVTYLLRRPGPIGKLRSVAHRLRDRARLRRERKSRAGKG